MLQEIFVMGIVYVYEKQIFNILWVKVVVLKMILMMLAGRLVDDDGHRPPTHLVCLHHQMIFVSLSGL